MKKIFILLIISLLFLTGCFWLPVDEEDNNMSVIDLGTAAIDRPTYSIEGNTYIELDNPANASGRITSVEIWADITLTGCKVATFYLVSGNNYSTRDYESIADVVAGGVRTFAVNLDVVAGDFIGIYYTGGRIEKDSTIGSRTWIAGNQIPCTNYTFNAPSLSMYSLYGIGTTVVISTTTQAVTAILSTTATGNGNITALGGENATKRGICYNLTGSPTVADSKVEESGSFGTGAFTESLINLSPGTTYHVKAYAYNSAGYGYGAEVDFTTNKVAPTVTTQIPTDVLQTTVTANGTIVASGGENATVRGFEYGLTQTGTWDAPENGSFPVGTFTGAITGLTANTSYWIRAYATNSIGTSYGAWVQFQTAAVGIIPTGTKVDLCADYSGYTYQLQASETDDGLPYSAYFVINTDLTSDKTGLTYYKRILDLDLYFRCEASGTAEIWLKRDSEADFQYLGSVGLTDITAPTIIIKHLAIDTKAKDFDFKVSYGNACRFLGVIFQFLPGGDR
jgi:hypothetical protein